MLVAFEAGSFFRALLLFLLYPLVCLVGEKMGLKIMVMVSFFGLKRYGFRVGRAVLPKFLLEDVGLEMFEVLRKGGKRVGVSNLPQVMVESFLRDYLEIDVVLGRELKVFCGYFVGVMEERKKDVVMKLVDHQGEKVCKILGGAEYGKSFDHDNQLPMFPNCKEFYMVSKADKKNIQTLPRKEYPKPLIFHDGRLALKPTPLNTLSLLMWIPLGLTLAFIRTFTSLLLPYSIHSPINAFTGMHLTVSKPTTVQKKSKVGGGGGFLYVCNHRTLLDPLYLSFILRRKILAVTYSISRMSEILSPIRTVRLTRNLHQDKMIMKRLLSQENNQDIAICPEGTTCREPYLLRFSPMFSEMCDEIVPVANNTHVSMFYGTTASGFKWMDPFFFLMNPLPTYVVHVLEKVSRSSVTYNQDSRFDVANHVQSELAKAFGFECTKLTRKDKYMVLADNEGLIYKS